MLYSVGSKLLIKFELDDPMESFLIYGIQGLWGTISVGLFDNKKGLLNTGDGSQLMIQVGGALAIIFWTASISFAVFTMIKKQSRFRVGKIFEVIGLDILTKPSNFDDLISVEIINKIEMRQRLDGESKKKNQRASN